MQAAPFVEPDRVGGAPPVVDVRSDIWAIGALLYTMLVGKAPPSGACAACPRTAPRGASRPSSRLASRSSARTARRRSTISPRRSAPSRRGRPISSRASPSAANAARPPSASGQHRERHGLGNIPNVLDKLDDAALARAQAREHRRDVVGPATHEDHRGRARAPDDRRARRHGRRARSSSRPGSPRSSTSTTRTRSCSRRW